MAASAARKCDEDLSGGLDRNELLASSQYWFTMVYLRRDLDLQLKYIELGVFKIGHTSKFQF